MSSFSSSFMKVAEYSRKMLVLVLNAIHTNSTGSYCLSAILGAADTAVIDQTYLHRACSLAQGQRLI